MNDQRCQFPLLMKDIPEATVVTIDNGKRLPHNRITFGKHYFGVAATGPMNDEQTAALFKAAIQEGCNTIVNLRIAMENNDYPPDAKHKKDYADVQIGNGSSESINYVQDHYECSLGVKVDGDDKLHSVEYKWLGNISSHTGADPAVLLDISRNVEAGPILVHCKKGAGRTAMFMLVHKLRQMIEVDESVNPNEMVQTVLNMVEEGRRDRGSFLETDAQLDTVIQAGAILLNLTDEQLAEQVDKALKELELKKLDQPAP